MNDHAKLATKTGRHALIRELLSRAPIASQTELAAQLSDAGVQVTQATLSRDLVELRAEKIRLPSGQRAYAVPGDAPAGQMDQELLASRLARLCAELLVTAQASGNLVVLATPPGAAHFLAAAIDHSVMPQIIGTVAGDDTVLVITRDPEGGASVAERFVELAGGMNSGQVDRNTQGENA